MCQLLVAANVVSSSRILVTLMMDLLLSSETPSLTTATQRNITDDGIFVRSLLMNISALM
jgi:hypothetical protein